ncbi:transposase [Streptomyces malaysiense]|uniref:transposase n=1 Tax=Streptomyces malaysiense TaxID=1428626 RepID=UPI001F0B37F8|nr:transposase [Streptomyces malaysiense]
MRPWRSTPVAAPTPCPPRVHRPTCGSFERIGSWHILSAWRSTSRFTRPADLDVLSHFRVEFYDCLYSCAGALFELTDAVPCADGPVQTLAELSLTVGHRRGHGALHAALDRGRPEPTRLRRTLAGPPPPKTADERSVLAVGRVALATTGPSHQW